MEKKIITQTELTNKLNEWLKTQPMPEYETNLERQKWWISKVIEFDKLTKDEYDIVDQEKENLLLRD